LQLGIDKLETRADRVATEEGGNETIISLEFGVGTASNETTS
jgi:hypothetical protein